MLIIMNNMKRYILTFIALCCWGIAQAQISLSAYFDGYWSDWKSCAQTIKIHGEYGGFIIYDQEEGPWSHFFKFTINNFCIPDKDTRKSNLKNDKWYEYSGTVEYYICDDYPTAYSVFKSSKAPVFVTESWSKKTERPIKKITSPAKIKIRPYKDHPEVYNIWYDNVGLGISLNGDYFEQ